jgi:hypothetical protein
MSRVSQGSLLDPLVFLVYLNDIWINIELTIGIFARHCIIYKDIISNKYMEELQRVLNRVRE